MKSQGREREEAHQNGNGRVRLKMDDRLPKSVSASRHECRGGGGGG